MRPLETGTRVGFGGSEGFCFSMDRSHESRPHVADEKRWTAAALLAAMCGGAESSIRPAEPIYCGGGTSRVTVAGLEACILAIAGATMAPPSVSGRDCAVAWQWSPHAETALPPLMCAASDALPIAAAASEASSWVSSSDCAAISIPTTAGVARWKQTKQAIRARKNFTALAYSRGECGSASAAAGLLMGTDDVDTRLASDFSPSRASNLRNTGCIPPSA